MGPWTKVDLGGRPGYLASSALSAVGGRPVPSYHPHWQSTPPALTLELDGLETVADRYALKGSIVDDHHVEDVFVVVSNQAAKIDSKKVFYRSNRKRGSEQRLDFETSVPLWPGANQVTVVARETSDVRTVQTFIIYRDATLTAAVTR
ncbi:MAG: hypothetical protein IPI49_18000 [Myxococcales bacterium]|nr:hypothetical protein [Myxococcales bacterium]